MPSFLKVLVAVLVGFSPVPAVFVMQKVSLIESAVNVPYAQYSLVKKALSFQIHEAALLNSVSVRYHFSGY